MPSHPPTTPGPSKTRAILIGVLGLVALFLLVPTNLASQGDDECGEADSSSQKDEDECGGEACDSAGQASASTNNDDCEDSDCQSSNSAVANTNDDDEDCVDPVTICHATGSQTNPYVVISPSASGVYDGHLGEDHQNGTDIIPPFMYEGEEYSQNWDAQGQAIFDDECDVEDACPGSGQATSSTHCTSSSSSTTGTSSSTTTTTSDTTTTSGGTTTGGTTTTGTTTTEVPFFTSGTAILLGVGGSLGGALLVMRRRL